MIDVIRQSWPIDDNRCQGSRGVNNVLAGSEGLMPKEKRNRIGIEVAGQARNAHCQLSVICMRIAK